MKHGKARVETTFVSTLALFKIWVHFSNLRDLEIAVQIQ